MTITSTLPEHSRVWVYQNTKEINGEDLPKIEAALQGFVSNWKSHNHALEAEAKVLQGRFLILAVDEGKEAASGCSIDTSVQFMKELERTYGLDLFNRMYFSYVGQDGEIKTVDHLTFAKLYADGTIDDTTKVMDTMVRNIGELQAGFVKSLSESWHKRMV